MRMISAKLGIGVAAAVLFAGCVQHQGPVRTDPVTETAAMTAGKTLTVNNAVGQVAVSGWDRDEVSVTYTKEVRSAYWGAFPGRDPEDYLAGMTVTVASDTNGVAVTTAFPSTEPHEVVSSIINLDIKMPRGGKLSVDMDAGNATVNQVIGGATVKLDAGNVSLSGVRGNILVDVNAGNAEILHPDLLGANDQITGNVHVGSIDLWLPSGAAFNMNATVDVGDIDAAAFPSLVVQRVDLVGKECRGSANGGGATIGLDVGTGNIDILAQ